MKDRSHDEAMAKLFQANPFYVDELLAEVRRTGDKDEMAILRRQLSPDRATKSTRSGDRKN